MAEDISQIEDVNVKVNGELRPRKKAIHIYISATGRSEPLPHLASSLPQTYNSTSSFELLLF